MDGWANMKFYHLNRHEYPMYKSLCDFVANELKRRLTLRSATKDKETPGSPNFTPEVSPDKSGEQLAKNQLSEESSPISKINEKEEQKMELDSEPETHSKQTESTYEPPEFVKRLSGPVTLE